ncbi:predicted protein [Naegleria gruberi]|uniref:Predicted protein n=1 Tax=Naegleria gruberi TaxID=5762 RepID=D2VXQ5_NAEGR|nr:uncharacterized protein NAEGRDRAFT_73832 [Naegleria gruberi]EFC38331.1 predicted protein [Naegleria gruberi]|eukprot:XP_002671075.1 predicted protein [Naegleria gruberi strain NEG-M]
MAMFVRDYPRVKELYTKLYEGSIEQSWTSILGKRFSEDEFDWIYDLETELPLNINGMYNIFKSITTKQTKDEIIDICDDEMVKSPLNPYIPLMKGVLFNNSESINQALEILKNSKQINIDTLHRIHQSNLYNNETTKERINDLKFTPILFWKCHFENSNSNVSDWIHQIETHSRFPTHYNLIQLGLTSSFRNGNYTRVLDFIQLMKHYESQIPTDELFESIMLGIEAARKLNRENELKSFIEMLIDKHGDNSPFPSLLQNLTNIESIS